ncbi:pyruvate kinase, partial [bacterium]|nr:pyruvate kinase [bacterium]
MAELDFTATKIVATLGPVSESREMIKNLFEAGVTMFRINSSHGSFEEHQKKIEYIREIEAETGVPIPILLDLQGPKIRVGMLEEPIELVKDSVIKLKHQKEYKNDIIPVDYEGIAKDATKGEKIFLDDGKLVLQVEDVKDEVLYAKVICGGLLKARKGINIPGNQGSLKVLTDKDKEYVKFGIENEVDYFGLSFV